MTSRDPTGRVFHKFSIGGEGGHGYIVVEPGTGRVFVSRGTRGPLVGTWLFVVSH